MDDAKRLMLLHDWIQGVAVDDSFSLKLWRKSGKVSEEAGELAAAILGVEGRNPRKGVTHTMAEVEKEFLDVVVTGLTGLELCLGGNGESMSRLSAHLEFLCQRAGLTGEKHVAPSDAGQSPAQ